MIHRTTFLNAVSIAFLGVFAWGALQSSEPAKAAEAQSVSQNSLGVTFKLDDPKEGLLRIALFDSAQAYNSGAAFVSKSVPVNARQSITTSFTDLKPGEYAIKVYYDEDSDRDLDVNALGVPDEAYGFSKNARALLSEPDWAAAKFEFKGGKVLRPIIVE